MPISVWTMMGTGHVARGTPNKEYRWLCTLSSSLKKRKAPFTAKTLSEKFRIPLWFVEECFEAAVRHGDFHKAIIKGEPYYHTKPIEDMTYFTEMMKRVEKRDGKRAKAVTK